MTDFELMKALVTHCGPYLAFVVAGTFATVRIIERHEFKKYEQRRRRYTEWRLSHLDEIQ